MRRWFYETREKESFQKSIRNNNTVVLSIVITSSQDDKNLLRILEDLSPLLRVRPIELVVLINKETENIKQVLSLFQDPNLKLIVNVSAKSRIKAIREIAKGEYLFWVEDDDLPAEELINEYLALVYQDPSLDIAYCDLEYKSKKDERCIILKQEDYSGASSLLLQSVLSGRGISLRGSITRRSLLQYMDLSDEKMAKYRFLYEVISSARICKLHTTTMRFSPSPKKIHFHPSEEYGYESYARLQCIKNTPLEKLFPDLDWKNPGKALQYSVLEIASGFMVTGDFFNAERFFALADFKLLSVSQITQYVTCLITLGNKNALKFFCESLDEESRGREFKESILNMIAEIAMLEQYSMNAYQERNQKELRKYLKMYHARIGKTFFTCTFNALRFKDKNNIPRACSAMIEALMMQPYSVSVHDWLLEHVSCSQKKEYVNQLRLRITGGAADGPLYHLSTFKKEYLCSGNVRGGLTHYEGFMRHGM
jgi:hypothetical protein